MKNRILIRLLLLALLAGPPLLAQQIEVSLGIELMIGTREDSAEYVFTGVSKICTDRSSNIYAGDRTTAGIRVYNENGFYKKTIGRRGQGPGEIFEVTDLYPGNDETLMLLDRRNRRLSLFGFSGGFLRSYPFRDGFCVDPFYVRQFSHGGFMLYLGDHGRLEQEGDSDIFYFYGSDFGKAMDSISDEGLLWDRSIQFGLAAVGESYLRLAMLADSLFLAVPMLYDGYLVKFEKNGSGWRASEVPGLDPGSRTHKVLDRSDYFDMEKMQYRDKEMPSNCFSRSGPLGSFLFRRLRQTRGIFQLENGIIVHFSYRHKRADLYEGMVEFFDADCRFLGYGVCDRRDFGDPAQKLVLREALWKDNEDRFYFNGRYNDVPVLVRARLDFSLPQKHLPLAGTPQ